MEIYCSKCGRPSNENSRFCTSCGHMLMNGSETHMQQQSVSSIKPQYQVPVKRTNTMVYIWIAIVIVLIVIGILFVAIISLIKGDDSDSDWTHVVATSEANLQDEFEVRTEELSTEEAVTTEFEEITTEYIEEVSDEPIENEMQSDWIYTNARFGYSVLIPADFSPSEREPDNGDGAWLYNKEGASLTVSGHYNVLPDTPASIVESYPNASYSYVGDNYCCVSFLDGENIVYIAYHVDEDLIYGFEIVYPESDSERYDKTIEEMLAYLVEEN